MRPLTEKEESLLRRIIGAIKGADILRHQVSSVRVRDDSTPTFLQFVVDNGPRAETFTDGPAPGRFAVRQAHDVVGEVLVWVKGGRLSALEYAWVTDAAPEGMPDPEDVDL